jgi:hypothetical protein
MTTISTRMKLIAVLAAVAGALAIPVSAYATGEPATSEQSVAAGECTRVDAPMLDIPTAGDTEPRMRIPQPAGWERVTDLGDVEVTRFALVHSDPVGIESSRKIVTVSLHRVPNADTQTNLDASRAELVELYEEKGGPTEMTTTAGTVCGLPAETNTYAGDSALGADPATVLFVAVNACGHSYVAMVTQTFEPDNPIYQRSAEMILSGFQVLPPAASV